MKRSLLFMSCVTTVALLPLVGVAAPPGAVCNGKEATITGTQGDDSLEGTSGRDVIAGLGGDDEIVGRDGNDLICGGLGADIVRSGRGGDHLEGGEGPDVLIGGSGADSVRGRAGLDLLRGSRGDDYLSGGDGEDRIAGQAGDDRLAGGESRHAPNEANAGDHRKDVLRGGRDRDTCRHQTKDELRNCELFEEEIYEEPQPRGAASTRVL